VRFIPPLILVAALAAAGCSSTVTGTAQAAGGGASSTMPSTTAPSTTSSSPTTPQTRTSTYDTSLVGVAEFPKRNAYTALPLTADKLLAALSDPARQLTTSPPGCYFTPGQSKDVLTDPATVLAAFKQPNGDVSSEIIAKDSVANQDALVQKAKGCASWTATGPDGASYNATVTTTTTTDATTGLPSTLISRTLTDGKETTEDDTIIGSAKGATAIFTLSFYAAGNSDQKVLVSTMTGVVLAKLAAAK
jgi:hypothetical protein